MDGWRTSVQAVCRKIEVLSSMLIGMVTVLLLPKGDNSGVPIVCKGPWDGCQIRILHSGRVKPTQVMDGEIQVLNHD